EACAFKMRSGTASFLPQLHVITQPCSRPSPPDCTANRAGWNQNLRLQVLTKRISAAIWEENMRSIVLAAFCVAGLALAAISGAVAAPVTPLGKAADAVDARTTAHYYDRHYHRYHHHHRHCWWRHGHRHCGW